MASILLIDDNDVFIEALRSVLQNVGHDVRMARSGQEALDGFADARPDLVITDMVMPDKDGIETIIELKQLDPGLRIIAMSGGGRVEPEVYLHTAACLGALRVLAKPFDEQQLLEAVRDVLASEPDRGPTRPEADAAHPTPRRP